MCHQILSHPSESINKSTFFVGNFFYIRNYHDEVVIIGIRHIPNRYYVTETTKITPKFVIG